jgi:hypothetical protein
VRREQQKIYELAPAVKDLFADFNDFQCLPPVELASRVQEIVGI